MKNTQGIFEIDLMGELREVKCNFNVVERLERVVLKRTIMEALGEAIQSKVYIGEVVDCVMEGLKANGDTRFTREQVGEYIQTKGVGQYVEWYMKFLTYALGGDKELQTEPIDDKKK